MVLSVKGKNNSNGSFNWADALVDAGISAGISASTSGLSMVATGVIYTSAGQLTLAFTVLGQFLGFLAVKRKLRPKE